MLNTIEIADAAARQADRLEGLLTRYRRSISPRAKAVRAAYARALGVELRRGAEVIRAFGLLEVA